MEIAIDPDVKAVAEFMQEKIETRKLIGVAEGLRAIAPYILMGNRGGRKALSPGSTDLYRSE